MELLVLSILYHALSSGSVFICLVVNTHLLWVKLSLLHTLLLIMLWLLRFFSELGFQPIISPSVPPLWEEAGGKGEQLEWV